MQLQTKYNNMKTLTVKHNGMTLSLVLPITTQHPDVPAYPKCDVQLIKLLLMMD